ncbi:gliding motility protein GldC [Limibacter armeniacum]|uniref:gliding motility protein GldC n=1 Tax=Limibacter armeniacum TaxID=466084 RepID=UPI002FE5622A
MRESDIRFKVELDDQNVPEKIMWAATDAPHVGLSETRAVNISLWDHLNRETLAIGLWGKEMTTDEMKYFAIDTIGNMANTIMTATGDQVMAKEMQALCQKLAKHIEETRNKEE